jgi:hypothetical protein
VRACVCGRLLVIISSIATAGPGNNAKSLLWCCCPTIPSFTTTTTTTTTTTIHNKQECNECYYAPNKGPKCVPQENGGFGCCGDMCPDHECFCPISKEANTSDRTTFRLKYQVNYT